MRRWWFWIVVLLLAACAEEGDPSGAMEQYLNARVASDADQLRQLSCADWEEQAIMQADSFRGMDARLEGMACAADDTEGDFTVVRCEGQIVTTYNGETREWPLGAYRLAQEDGEWKMCGEAE